MPRRHKRLTLISVDSLKSRADEMNSLVQKGAMVGRDNRTREEKILDALAAQRKIDQEFTGINSEDIDLGLPLEKR